VLDGSGGGFGSGISGLGKGQVLLLLAGRALLGMGTMAVLRGESSGTMGMMAVAHAGRVAEARGHGS
jgi:hypothetical protein